MKIVKNPSHQAPDDMMNFVASFRANSYDIITSTPVEENAPELLVDDYMDLSTHQRILNDPAAYFNFYSIHYKTPDNSDVIVPVGLYGVSENMQMRFPLLINWFWQTFLMIDKATFFQLCGIEDGEEGDAYFLKLIGLRRDFIHNIFKYYFSLDTESSSAMAWDIRGRKSSTRTIAESLDFQRLENNGFEIYSSTSIPEEKWEYLKHCVLRWGITVDKKKRPVITAETNANAGIFLKNMINYNPNH